MCMDDYKSKGDKGYTVEKVICVVKFLGFRLQGESQNQLQV